MKKKKVYLTLENGKVLQGYRFGADGEAVGELVFTTGMVGYDKTLTDPAYYGQINRSLKAIRLTWRRTLPVKFAMRLLISVRKKPWTHI